MKSLAVSFFVSGRMTTTEAKAKQLRPMVEKLITRAKNPTLANKRYLASVLPVKSANKTLEFGKTFTSRTGGYTRIIKAGVRKSDSARMAIIEIVK